VGDGGSVLDQLDVDPSGLKRRDGRFSSGAGTFDPYFDILHPKLGCFFGSLLGGALACERGAFAGTLETARTGTGPAERVALGVSDRHMRVVEGCFDVSDCRRHIASHLTPLVVCILVGLLLCHGIVLVSGERGKHGELSQGQD